MQARPAGQAGYPISLVASGHSPDEMLRPPASLHHCTMKVRDLVTVWWCQRSLGQDLTHTHTHVADFGALGTLIKKA